MSVPIKVEIICVEMEKSRIAVLTLFKGISKIKDWLPCDRDNSELVTRDKSLRKCLANSLAVLLKLLIVLSAWTSVD